jgi:DNA (cytosine-5)-methyltransferase 1
VTPPLADCLQTTAGDYSRADGFNMVGDTAQVRRLTPVECERLQGFPDGWTIPDDTPWQDHPKPDGPRYAQMGNAVTVPVAEWIGRRIMEYGE